jgi:hypothetical protein
MSLSLMTPSTLKFTSGDIRQYECNSWRMAGRIFMKFVFEIMPLEPSPKSHFFFPLFSNKNVMDAQIREVEP